MESGQYFASVSRLLSAVIGVVVMVTSAALLGFFGVGLYRLHRGGLPSSQAMVFLGIVGALGLGLCVVGLRLVGAKRRRDGGLFSPWILRLGGVIFLFGPVAAVLLLFGLNGLELVVRRLAQLLLFHLAIDRPHVRFLEGEIAHVDVDHLSAINRELLGQCRINVGRHPGALCNQIRRRVLRGNRFEYLMGRRLNIRRQIAVMAVLVGADAVTNGKAHRHRLRIARGAGRILDVCLLRSDRKQRQLLPWRQHRQPLGLNPDDLAELSDDTPAPGWNRIERPDNHQQDQDAHHYGGIADDRGSAQAVGSRITSCNVHLFPLQYQITGKSVIPCVLIMAVPPLRAPGV